MLKSVNAPIFTRMVSCAPALIRPGCAGSVLPLPMPGRLNDPLTTPLADCVRLKDAPTSGPLVTSQLPDIVPTTKVRVSCVAAPRLSVTVRRARPLPPVQKLIVPLVPENGLPATSHA